MTHRLKVAFVSQPMDYVFLPVQSGSVPIWTWEVARRLAKDCDVLIYTCRAPGQSKCERFEGVEFVRFPMALDRLLERTMRLAGGLASSKEPIVSRGWFHLPYAHKVARDLRTRRCDIVQLFNLSQFIPVIRALNPATRIAIRMGCEWLTQFNQAVIEPRLRQADLIVGCSDYITNKVRRKFPHLAERCRTVLNGRDVRYFLPLDREEPRADGSKHLLFVGRVSPEKGVHVLLDAFRRVVSRCPDARLSIVGPAGAAPLDIIIRLSDDPKVRALEALYSGGYHQRLMLLPSDIAGKVTFPGFVPHRQLLNHYRVADVFVFPSIWDEPSGNPLIEAMAAGIPVVSTRTGGTPEYIADGETGLLVEPDDPEGLANAIVRLLEDRVLRAAMGQAGRRRALEMFSCERMAENVLKEYRMLCGLPLSVPPRQRGGQGGGETETTS